MGTGWFYALLQALGTRANVAGYNCEDLNILYFYHPDYLGSVEFVTDMRGEPYQFFLNTPWGENLENQFAHNYTSFSSRFRFNEGRALRNRPVAYFSEGARLPRGQRDWESGYFYLPAIALVKAGGARYCNPELSACLVVKRTRWLSVDPLASDAPHLTPYRFSFNNPLNVGPNGLFEGVN